MLKKAIHPDYWERLKQGDPGVLEDLYNTCYIGLINYGIRLTGDRELSNDCITQVLLRLWDKRATLPPIHHFYSYLLTCLRRELLMELRSKGKRAAFYHSHSWDESDQEPSYEDHLVHLQGQAGLKNRLVKALSQLTAREKELLRLKFFENLDYDTIAMRCNITKRTAYNTLHGAIRTLREHLAETPSEVVPRLFSIELLVLCGMLLLEIS